MIARNTVLFTCLMVLAACGIPPMDPTFVSKTPANARSFAVAQDAARACIGRDRAASERKFRRAGFGFATQKVKVRGGREIDRFVITPPDDAVSVLYSVGGCHIGLEDMTPSQSAQLAQIWVKAYDAKPNSEFGDGLSDHVSGAWRNFFTEPHRFPDKAAYAHRIYIAAFKTWPQGPYDPQRNVPYNIDGLFPDKPGAAIRLSHVEQCIGHIKTGPRSGAFLPCSGATYRPG